MKQIISLTLNLLFERLVFKIPFCHGGIEYAKFTLVENQFMKLYSGRENLDTKSRVLRLPFFAFTSVSVYNRLRVLTRKPCGCLNLVAGPINNTFLAIFLESTASIGTGSISLSGQLRTYPSPNPTCCSKLIS